MDTREKLERFAEMRGWNKNKLIGWSEASDFGAFIADQLSPYLRHKDGCEERGYYQSLCKKCGYLLKDHDAKFCVVVADGKVTYHDINKFEPELNCTCGLDQLKNK